MTGNFRYCVTLHKTTFPAVYLAVGEYTDEKVATEVFRSLRTNVTKSKYDKSTLIRVEYDRPPHMSGAVPGESILLRSNYRGEMFIRKMD